VLQITRDLTSDEFRRLLFAVSPERRAALARLRRVEDRRRALLGDVLARFMIAGEMSLRADELTFAADRYGKPALAGRAGPHFNVSHSGAYVVCAVSEEAVGVDVEVVGTPNLNVARRFFHDAERDYVLSHAADGEKTRAFYRIWTMKESYIKRDGRGLGVPLASFNVLDARDVCFSAVIDNPEAVCHVCRGDRGAPKTRRMPLEEILSFF
jgi:4'-phosphopantetheinyl transferase